MRIVVRSADARQARDAQARLAAAGIEAIALPGFSRAAPDGEDITVFCGPGAHVQTRNAAARPLTALAALTSPPDLGLNGAPFGAIAIEAHPRLLATQFEEHVRAAIIEEEAARRRATLDELNIAPPPRSIKKPHEKARKRNSGLNFQSGISRRSAHRGCPPARSTIAIPNWKRT